MKTYELDVSDLHPQIAVPESPDNVDDISTALGRKIDYAFIGTCCNGRLEDLQAAAAVLKGKRIKRIVPGDSKCNTEKNSHSIVCWRHGTNPNWKTRRWRFFRRTRKSQRLSGRIRTREDSPSFSSALPCIMRQTMAKSA